MRVFIIGFSALVAAGCVSLSPKGESVRIGKIQPHANCKELGIVYGSAKFGDIESKMKSAQNDLRNKTANLGGNFVVMDISGGDAQGISLSGRAYFCCGNPPNNTASQPEPKPQASPEERFKTLKKLLDQGFISQEEYDKRRQEILQ